MRKLLLLVIVCFANLLHADGQLALTKILGKNAKDHKAVGFGVFGNYTIPLGGTSNKNLMIELMDLVYFPGKIQEAYPYDQISRLYLSIKAGYRYIFCEEDSKTGFFIEPQLGYARVVVVKDSEPEAKFGDGIAAALEGGYSLEVGQKGNSLTFSLKYEADMAGKDYTIHSLGLRFGFNFWMYRGRNR
jgi:hypothetical protein